MVEARKAVLLFYCMLFPCCASISPSTNQGEQACYISLGVQRIRQITGYLHGMVPGTWYSATCFQQVNTAVVTETVLIRDNDCLDYLGHFQSVFESKSSRICWSIGYECGGWSHQGGLCNEQHESLVSLRQIFWQSGGRMLHQKDCPVLPVKYSILLQMETEWGTRSRKLSTQTCDPCLSDTGGHKVCLSLSFISMFIMFWQQRILLRCSLWVFWCYNQCFNEISCTSILLFLFKILFGINSHKRALLEFFLLFVYFFINFFSHFTYQP